MATTATRLMTAEVLARIPNDGHQYELVRGVLRRMPLAGFWSSNTTARIIVELGR